MTLFGKILIFITVALSVMFATWAVGVYANRIDWGNTAESAGVAKGKYRERADELKAAEQVRNSAVQRWEKALAQLRTNEAARPERQKWYAEQIKLLETGLDAKGNLVNQPVQQFVIVKGQVQLDQNGLPRLQPIEWTRTQPLLDLNRLGQEFDKTMKEIAAEKVALDKVVEEEKRLTEDLNGDGKQKKGLRTQVAEQQEERQNSLTEQEYLRPLLYNRLVESQLVLKRQRALESRLRELKGAAADSARLP